MGDLYSDGPPRRGLSTGAIVAIFILGVLVLGGGVSAIIVGSMLGSESESAPPLGPEYYSDAVVTYEVWPYVYTKQAAVRVRLTWNNNTGGQEQQEVTLHWDESIADLEEWQSQGYEDFEVGDALYLHAEILEGHIDALDCYISIGDLVSAPGVEEEGDGTRPRSCTAEAIFGP